jgi:hypothetical protein
MRGKLMAALCAGAVALGWGASVASAETVWTIRPGGAPAGSPILWLTGYAGKVPTLEVAAPNIKEQTWNLVSTPGHNIVDPQFQIRNRATGSCLGVIGYAGGTYVTEVSQDIFAMRCRPGDDDQIWQLVIPTPSRTFGPLRLPLATSKQPYLLRNLGLQECLWVPGGNFLAGLKIDNTNPCAKYDSTQFWWLSRGEV